MPAITHSGLWAGYRSVTLRIPEKQFAAAILSNTGDMDTWDLAIKIADLYLGDSPAAPARQNASKTATPPAAVKGDPATWEPLLGTYRLAPGWLLTITHEGGQLMTQATHEDKCPMTPAATNTFFVEAYGQAVEFVRQPSGSVTNLLYRGINAPKLHLPELGPARLAEYAGDYWSEELQAMTRIEVHDGKLATRQRSGNWIELLPTGADHFDTDSGGFAVEFTRGQASEVTEAKVSGYRVRNMRYTRVTLPQSKLPGHDSKQ
jgi:hypothetical protein